MGVIVSAIGQGIIWSLLGIGLYLSFRILNFPDMTVEGTFPLGAAVSVTLVAQGVNPFLTIIIAGIIGGVAGLVTGLLYTKGQIPIFIGWNFDYDGHLFD